MTLVLKMEGLLVLEASMMDLGVVTETVPGVQVRLSADAHDENNYLG